MRLLMVLGCRVVEAGLQAQAQVWELRKLLGQRRCLKRCRRCSAYWLLGWSWSRCERHVRCIARRSVLGLYTCGYEAVYI